MLFGMKCIILAAGEGVRMRPLTLTTPKPMLRVSGKPLLQHLLEAVPDEISEFLIVVGYLGSQIKEFFGDSWHGKPITYITQNEKRGTAHALSLCEEYLKSENMFMVMFADDIHGSDGVRACIERRKPSILVAHVDDPRKFGVVEIDAEGKVIGLEEKPENPKTNLVGNGVYVLTKYIFDYPVPMRDNGEEYLPERIAAMIKAGHEFYAVESTFWHPVGYPEDLQKAEEILQQEE